MKYFVLTYLILSLSFSVFCQRKNLADKWRNIAEQYYDKDKKDSASIYYKKAFNLSSQKKDYLRMANLSVDISTMDYDKRNYLEALKWCKKGFVFLKKGKVNSDSVLFKLYSSSGEMYKKLNRVDSCQFLFQKANTLLINKPQLETQIPEYVIPYYSNQAIFLIDRHQFSQVDVVLNQAISISKKNNNLHFISVIYSNLAYNFEKQKLYQLAIFHRKKALSYCGNKDNYPKSILLLSLANDFIKLKNHREAKQYLYSSIRIYQQTKKNITLSNQDPELTQAFCQFEILKAEHNLQAGIKTLRKIIVLPFNGSSQGYEIITKAYNEMAMLEMAANHYQTAFHYIQKALQRTQLGFKGQSNQDNPPINDQVLSFETLIESLSIKTRLWQRVYQTHPTTEAIEQASICALKTLEAIAFVKKNQTIPEYNTYLGNGITEAQGIALQLSYEYWRHNYQAQPSIAQQHFFKVIELSREITIGDAILERNTLLQTIPTTDLADLADLRKDIASLKIKMITQPKDSTAKQALFQKKLAYSTLIESLQQQYPTYYQTKLNNNNAVSLANIQQNLSAETTYITYTIFHDELYLMAVQKKEVRILKQTLPKDFTLALARLQQEISTPPGMRQYKGSSDAIKLYNTLIKPIEAFIASSKHLLISRDLRFGILPFEVLESGKTLKDYLCKKYYIAYTYSAGIWNMHQPKTVSKNTLIAFAPFSDTIAVNNTLVYNALGKSKEEALSINENSFVDSLATKKNFLAHYQNYKVLYLPTHAKTNDQKPSESHIAFYPTVHTEYRLFLDEIYTLNLKDTRLVVLDACEAEKGQVQTGEGMISLSRAFAYSGCPSVVSTHWKANDVTSSALTQILNKYLLDGVPIDIALQKARVEFWQSNAYKKFNHPFFWANFILIGRNDAVFDPSPFPWGWFSAGTIVFITLCLGWFIYKKSLFIPLPSAIEFGTKFSTYLTKLPGIRSHRNR